MLSVLIPTYNRPDRLRRCLYSALSLPVDGLEVVVCDNNEDDVTERIVRGIGDERIRYFRNPENIGPERNMLRCFHEARTPYVLTVSDDDYVLPTAAAVFKSALSKRPDFGLVLTPMLQAADAGGMLPTYPVVDGDEVLEPGADTLARYFMHGHIFSRWLCRRDAIDLDGYERYIGQHLYSIMWMPGKLMLEHPVVLDTMPVVLHTVGNPVDWAHPDDQGIPGLTRMLGDLIPERDRARLGKKGFATVVEAAVNSAIAQAIQSPEACIRFVSSLEDTPEIYNQSDFWSALMRTMRPPTIPHASSMAVIEWLTQQKDAIRRAVGQG